MNLCGMFYCHFPFIFGIKAKISKMCMCEIRRKNWGLCWALKILLNVFKGLERNILENSKRE